MRKMIIVLYLFGMLLCGQMCMTETVDSLTYAVFSYLPDCTYYQEIIEARWAELELDIRLIRAENGIAIRMGNRRGSTSSCMMPSCRTN